MRYIVTAEQKFEDNWENYEQQLEKYLTKSKEFTDWIQKKDEAGGTYWLNLKTLKEQKEHPGQRVFQVNKKVLKAKAEEEMRGGLRPIYERR